VEYGQGQFLDHWTPAVEARHATRLGSPPPMRSCVHPHPPCKRMRTREPTPAHLLLRTSTKPALHTSFPHHLPLLKRERERDRERERGRGREREARSTGPSAHDSQPLAFQHRPLAHDSQPGACMGLTPTGRAALTARCAPLCGCRPPRPRGSRTAAPSPPLGSPGRAPRCRSRTVSWTWPAVGVCGGVNVKGRAANNTKDLACGGCLWWRETAPRTWLVVDFWGGMSM